MRISVANADFGTVNLRFDQAATGLAVNMTNADPEFAATARSALAERGIAVAATADAARSDAGGGRGDPGSGQAGQQSAANQSGGGQSSNAAQTNTGQQQHRSTADTTTDTQPGNAGTAAAEPLPEDRASGLYI